MTTLPEDVIIRPIRADDVQRLQDFHRRLSMKVILLRFHGYLRELPDSMARRFCEVDGVTRVAFVAVTGEPERIVGVGRFDRVEDGVAEAAFVVEDAFQRRGVGSALLNHLLQAALERNMKTLLARILHGNRPIQDLLRHTGYPITVQSDRDSDAFRLDLSAYPRGKQD